MGWFGLSVIPMVGESLVGLSWLVYCVLGGFPDNEDVQVTGRKQKPILLIPSKFPQENKM